MSTLKQRLREGRIVAGPFMKLASPAVVEIFGHAGFDFVIIDLEHGPLSSESVENMVRAAELAGISPVVRVRRNDPSLCARALDVGAEGILVPQVATAEEARGVVRGARFAPEGERGVCRYVRAAAYSREDKFSYFRGANEKTAVIVLIEGARAIANLEQIIAVPGIDVIFIGPYDLSQSLGVPGEVNHPQVMGKMRDIVSTARLARLAVGTFVDDLETAGRWMELGVQFIAYMVDVGIIYQASREIVGRIKEKESSC